MHRSGNQAMAGRKPGAGGYLRRSVRYKKGTRKCGVHKTVDSYSSLHGCGCSCFFLIYDNMEPNKSTNCIFMRCCLSGLKCQYSKYTSIFGGYKR